MSENYSWQELCEMTNISGRTFRKYAQEGLIPDPPYDEMTFARLAAIEYLKTERGMKTLASIKGFLGGMTDQEVFDMVAITEDDEGKAVGGREDPSGIQPAAAPEPPIVAAKEHPQPQAPEPRPETQTVQTWTRVLLAPGLELHLSADAPEEARQLAEEIQNLWKPGASD